MRSPKNDVISTETRKHLAAAPPILVRAYASNPTGQVSLLLGRLVSDPKMTTAWKELSKRTRSDREWICHWQAIKQAYFKSRRSIRSPSRAIESKRFLEVEKLSRFLAQAIQGRELDLLAYELFPVEDMELLGVKNWDDLDSLDRDVEANKLLSYWPTAAELLFRLAHLASLRALHARNRPALVERKTRDTRLIAFVRVLGPYFKENVGSPMYGTTAVIASVALQTNCERYFVNNALTRRGK